MKYVIALMALCVMTSSKLLNAAPVDFLPKFAVFDGELEFEGLYSSIGKAEDGDISKNEKIAFRERLLFETIGYVYHPSLLLFKGSIAGNLNQDQNRSGTSGWRGERSTDEEYEIEGVVLGRKPYNLEFDASLDRPFSTAGYRNYGEAKSNFKSGVTLNYKKRPLKSSLSYIHRASETKIHNSEARLAESLYEMTSDSIRGDIRSHGKNYSYSSYITHKVSSDISSGTTVENENEATDDGMGFNGSLKYKQATILGSAQLEKTQRNNDDFFRFSISDRISIDLPWNMDADILSSYSKNETTVVSESTGEGKESVSINKQFKGEVRHQLFDSIKSKVSAEYRKNDTTTSSRTNQDFNARAAYSKMLRGGGVVIGLENELYRTGQQGEPEIENERYDDVFASVIDTPFSLRQPNVDIERIRVEIFNSRCLAEYNSSCGDFAEVVQNGGGWQSLSRTVQWDVVDPLSQFVRIDIIDVTKTPALPPPIGTHHKIRVSYSLREADFVVQSNKTTLFSALDLFNKSLSVQYDYSLTTQKYVDGDETFGDLSPTVAENFLGFTFNKEPFVASTSYRIINSEQYDEQRWVMEGAFRKGVNILSNIPINWGVNYKREELVEEDSSGTTLKNVETRFVTGLSASGNVPYIGLKVTPRSSFTRHIGVVRAHRVNADGIWTTFDVEGENDNDVYSNRVNFSMIIPYLKVKTTFYVTYDFEDNFTNRNTIVTRENGFDARRTWSWLLGGTNISLSGNYFYTNKLKEITSASDVVHTTSLEEEELEIILTANRKFF